MRIFKKATNVSHNAREIREISPVEMKLVSGGTCVGGSPENHTESAAGAGPTVGHVKKLV